MKDVEIKMGRPYNGRDLEKAELGFKVELSASFQTSAKALEFQAELVALARKFEGTS